MTPDEKLESVTSDLQALSRDVQDLRTTVNNLNSAVQSVTAAIQQHGGDIRMLTGIAETTHDSVKSLETIVAAHERRLDQLENR